MVIARSTVCWADGSAFRGMLWNHWRIGEDAAGHGLYAALLDYGAGWKRRLADQTHHFASSWAMLRRTGSGSSETFHVLQPDLLCGNPSGPDDASVWPGSVVKTVHEGEDGSQTPAYGLFYAGRRLLVPRAVLGQDSEMDQEIRLAVLRQESLPGGGDPVWRVHRTQFVFRPDANRHVSSRAPGPSVIPAFRDPFVFADPFGQVYLVVSTREADGLTDNDASLSFYALDGALDDPMAYRHVGRYAPGCYLEMEGAHLSYAEAGTLVLTFSTGSAANTPDATVSPVGCLQGLEVELDAQGRLRFDDGELQVGPTRTLLDSSQGLYGGWIDEGVVRAHGSEDGGLYQAGPAPWNVSERLDLSVHAVLRAPLGRVSELTDSTHQWDLRRAALFTRNLDAAQRQELQRGSSLLSVLTTKQRKLLDDFYAGRI